MLRCTVSLLTLAIVPMACVADDPTPARGADDPTPARGAAALLDPGGRLPQADPIPFTCGYALPGFGCNNGRGHIDITSGNLASAIAACHAMQPPSLPDFCYVIDVQGGGPTDASVCAAAGGSWRSGNSCCNFLGSVSCPATYTCGYALSGFGCNNGRGHIDLHADTMSAAITACHAAQPASLPDFCHVKHAEGAAPTDPTQCAAGGGSWRASSLCCNFQGTLSCP